MGFVAVTGWYVAQQGWGNIIELFEMLGGTLLVCAGVGALNHVIEWRSDSLMNRTRNRPIPSGKIGFYPALIVGSSLALIGLILMGYTIGMGMVIGASLTGFLYLFIYTPLKKITWINTTIGAIPGALPIMGGWYAARGELGLEGWVLLMLLFFWQHPHFYAIAWICREDYGKVGYHMLVKNDSSGRMTFSHAFIHTLLLMIVSTSLIFTDFSAGWIYLITITFLNLYFLTLVFISYRDPIEKKNQSAQKIITFSICYQILFLVFIVLDTMFRVTIF